MLKWGPSCEHRQLMDHTFSNVSCVLTEVEVAPTVLCVWQFWDCLAEKKIHRVWQCVVKSVPKKNNPLPLRIAIAIADPWFKPVA